MGPFRIIVLTWVDALAGYAMQILVTFLTDVWKLHFTHAAAIVNVYMGMTSMMQIGMAFLAHTCVGNYLILLISSIAYSTGLSFLAVSTLPILSKEIGICNAYPLACISNPLLFLLYMPLVLIAIGKCGHVVSLGMFLAEQLTNQSQEDIAAMMQREFWRIVIGFFFVLLVLTIASITLPFMQTWSILFGIPAIYSVAATYIFWKGSSFYACLSPSGSPLTILIRVFVASALKIHLRLPIDPHRLYERHDLGDDLVPHTNGFSFLDKAAVTVPSQNLEEQEQNCQNRWKLCRVTEVEKVKIILSMIPLWMTFIIHAVISSIGSTFFLEQATNMNRKVIGNFKVPLLIFLIFCHTANSRFVRVYSKIESILGASRRKYAPPIGFAVAMMFSNICCIIAARVEGRRLDVIKGYKLVDEFPMSILWLVPQFVLLFASEKILGQSFYGFSLGRVPPSMMIYTSLLMDCFVGAGTIGGALSMHVAGKISGRGGKPSWFQDTLNKSRLDKYYWALAVLGSINLLFYVLVALCYSYKDSPVEEEEVPVEEPREDRMQPRFEVERYREVLSESYNNDDFEEVRYRVVLPYHND